MPRWLKVFFIAPQPLLRFADAMHCPRCDVVQKQTAAGCCIQCGSELASIKRMFEIERRYIRQLSLKLHEREQVSQARGKGSIKPYPPKLFLAWNNQPKHAVK